MTSYDFRLGARRVEIKSARLAHSSQQGRWIVDFANIKLPYRERTEPAFDDLYLVIMSPRGLHLIEHDLVTGVSTCGKSTELGGHVVRVYGSVGTHDWEDALDEILQKLCVRGVCRVIDEKPFSALDVKKILSQRVSPGREVVAEIPMSNMSISKRGKQIQEVGLAIDRRLHPRCPFSFAEGNRGKANAPADWVRGTDRVELKSSGLIFNRTNHLWQCSFQRIKPDLFDELWLAIYTLVGIHYYRSKSCESLGLSNAGAATTVHGHQLTFCGPRGELDPFAAFKVIEAKMVLRGCELIAIVAWEKGSATPPTGLDLLAGGKRFLGSCCSVVLPYLIRFPLSPVGRGYQAHHCGPMLGSPSTGGS